MSAKPIAIDPEFQSLVPPLSEEESAHLEASIRTDGCLDAIATWRGVIIDGHNRYAICQKHGIKFKTVEINLPDRHAAKEWIIHHQFARRNLTTYARAELALKLEELISSRAKANLKTSTGGSEPRPLLNSTKAGTVHTREELAKVADVSTDAIRKAKDIAAKADEKTKEEVRKGDISLNEAHNRVAPPKPKPKPDGHEGKTLVNGTAVADPPDIAKARAKGRIATDAVVEITEPGSPPEVDDAASQAPEAPMSDEEWLVTLPARTKLGANARVIFDRDALAYRQMTDARKTFAFAVRSTIKAADRRGSLPSYLHRLRSFLKINDPKHWIVCPATEHGGCGGSGEVGLIGQCPKCRGGGYLV